MIFRSQDQAQDLFVELFTILHRDDNFIERVRAGGLSLHVRHTDPDVEIFVDSAGVTVGPAPYPATVRIRMSCDTAHSLWSGTLLMPLALARGKVRIKGSVARVLEFVPMLRPAFDRYSDLAAAAGIRA